MNRRCVLTLLLAALLAPGGRAWADEIDDAAALPGDEAAAALEVLLEQADAGPARRLRLERALGDAYLRAGDSNAAVPHLEAVVAAAPQDAQARIIYAEALLAVARAHIAGEALGRNIMPFLRDALDTVAPLSPGADPRYDETWRARLARVVMEAQYLRQDHDAALAWAQRADLGSFPKDIQPALRDLEARVLYARGDLEAAAEAFDRAGNPLGAAAAFDAARKPDRSLPVYARLVAAAPADAALLDRALASARYHKAHGALLAALAEVPVPDGVSGVALLRARAELLEGGGRAADALPLLRDAAARDPSGASALLDLGRLTIVAAADPLDPDAWDAAADAYIQALEREPEGGAAVDAISWLASKDFGRLWNSWRDPRVTGRCVRVQEALVRVVPDDALAWANLGNTLRVLGRHEEALAAYEQARQANPYDPAVRSDHGLALSAAGRAQDALEAYEDSVRLDTGHTAGGQNAARGFWRLGRDEAAEAYLAAAARTSRAVGVSPGSYRFLLDRIWRTRQAPSVR